jgi:indolepyruvate ferredoxin oxidoreductase beta subunit
MSYEDTIRVADLKIRSTRFARVRDEVQAAPAQLMHVTEYMHPRLEEVCETLPAGLGRWILDNRTAASLLTPFLRKGRHVTTTRLHWFLALRMVAGMRRWRRSTLRFQLEQARIESWLQLVRDAVQSDPAAAAELVECQRLVKGYGDTHARGLASYKIVTDAFARLHGRSDAAAILRQLREAALKDEHGNALAAALADLQRAA